MPDDPILARVRRVVTEIAGPSRAPADAGPDTPLADGGFWLDSVDMVDVIVACEQEFRVTFDAELDLLPEALDSIGSLAALVRRKAQG